jgi:hypothetical protein
MKLSFFLCIVLAVVGADGQVRDLADVRRICVSQLGGDDAEAAMAREQLIARLSKENRLQLTENCDDCDAQIVGRVQVTRGQSTVVLGTMGRSGPVEYHHWVLRVVAKDTTTIWAYDSALDKKNYGFTKSLLKAIEAAEKKRKR